jgi:pimeloyl-ACP methyl ester carboxylesterase
MDALKLKDAVVVGWSNGCDDAYGYFRSYATDNTSAFVCIDETPRQTSTQKGDWADFTDVSEIGSFLNAVVYDRRALVALRAPLLFKSLQIPF